MAPRHRLLVVLALVFAALCSALASAQTASNASFCELCRDKGTCAQAYRGSPGIYCGAWLSAASQRMACCCPSTGQCAKTPSNYECMCQGGSSNANPVAPTTLSPTTPSPPTTTVTPTPTTATPVTTAPPATTTTAPLPPSSVLTSNNATFSNVTLSTCDVCRDTGNCAQAYRGSPGVFCGAWLNAGSQRMACCCPSTGQCGLAASNYECVCASVPAPTPKASSSLSASTKRIIIAVVVFLGAAMMFALCWHWYQNYYHGPLARTVVVHQPVYAPPPPAAFTAQPYANPAHAQAGPKFHTTV